MEKAIIIHGWSEFKSWSNERYPTPSNSAFIPWLSKQLMIKGIHPISIEMPNSYSPNYDLWKKELERFEIDNNTTLIGWSCGGGFLVRYLSEKSLKFKKLILLSPWIGDFVDSEDRGFDYSFFDFEIDEHLFKKSIDGVYIFEAEQESDDVLASIKTLRNKLKDVEYRVIEGSGRHFHEVEQYQVLGEILRSKNDNFNKLA